MDLSDKNVVITGGVGGIGYESCKEFLKNGVKNLAILDIKDDFHAVQQLAEAHPNAVIVFIKTDVTKKPEIEESFKKIKNKFKYIDVILTCSGVGEQTIEITIGVNLLGVIYTSLVGIEYMSKEKGGRGGLIANVASVSGLDPIPPSAVYTASKHGVIGFTRSVADPFYFEKTGVAFILICPGLTMTPLITTSNSQFTFEYSRILAETAWGSKMQTAEECAINIIKAIQSNKNGTIWICDLGKIRQITPTVYWTPQAMN